MSEGKEVNGKSRTDTFIREVLRYTAIRNELLALADFANGLEAELSSKERELAEARAKVALLTRELEDERGCRLPAAAAGRESNE